MKCAVSSVIFLVHSVVAEGQPFEATVPPFEATLPDFEGAVGAATVDQQSAMIEGVLMGKPYRYVSTYCLLGNAGFTLGDAVPASLPSVEEVCCFSCCYEVAFDLAFALRRRWRRAATLLLVLKNGIVATSDTMIHLTYIWLNHLLEPCTQTRYL